MTLGSVIRRTAAAGSLGALVLVAGACGGDSDSAGAAGAMSGGSPTGSGGAGGSNQVDYPADGTLPQHPKTLPFEYTRPEAGTPVSDADISALTDVYLDLMAQSRYFDFLDERVHGWPESDPRGLKWYGTWWSGADVYKMNGAITYHHNDGGGDNNGLRTAPLLEGACFAYLVWKDAKVQHLVRRLMRGMSSWALAIVKPGGEPEGALLSRAAYLVNFTDVDRGLSVDYSLNRPGVDNGATNYVHLPDNPYWGDLYFKNKRSKDDIGHMLRAVAQIDACDGIFDEAGAADDLKELRRLYVTWTRRVEDDGWKIATYDQNLALYYPDSLLANFVLTANAECTAALAIRLFGRFSPRDDLSCGNGIGGLDALISGANDQNGQILRTFHEAAANAALIANEPSLAKQLLEGLAQRIDESLDGFESGMPPKYMSEPALSDLIIFSANAGVPLTWREVRWLHQHLQVAHDRVLAADNFETLHTKDPATPDGSWRYEPNSDGIDFKTLGALLGTCVSQYRNPTSKPVLDCARVSRAPVP